MRVDPPREFTFAGWRFEQDERIHVAWVEGSPTWRPAALEAFEALSFQGARWWTAQELAATGDQVWPSRLGALLPPIVAGDLPDPPLDVGE